MEHSLDHYFLLQHQMAVVDQQMVHQVRLDRFSREVQVRVPIRSMLLLRTLRLAKGSELQKGSMFTIVGRMSGFTESRPNI